MSALVVVLPQVWATACGYEAPGVTRLGPQRVRLSLLKPERVQQAEPLARVQANAEPAAAVLPEVAFYRKYTEDMLRRYMRLSMGVGRAPSLLGRELFRGPVKNYVVHSFDDAVIFVHDVDSCLARLQVGQRHLIRRIAMQEYTQPETASLLGLSVRGVARLYSDALDELTAMFLEKNLLEPHKKTCQEAEAKIICK